MEGIDYNLDADVIAKEGSLVAIQRKVVELLRAVPEIAALEQIFIEDSLDLSYEIDKALTSGLLSICVSIGKATDSAPTVPGVIMLDPCEITIRCIENPTVNRAAGGTGITRNRAAEIIAKALKLERINNGFLTKPRLTDSALPKDADVVGKDITFTLSAAI